MYINEVQIIFLPRYYLEKVYALIGDTDNCIMVDNVAVLCKNIF